MTVATQGRRRNLLNLIAAGSFVLAAGGLIPLHAQQADRAAAKANARTSSETTTKPSAVEQDSRMVGYRIRAKSRWHTQQIATRKAEGEYHRARLEREVAEIARLDYEECVSTQDPATAVGEIALAESDLSRAEDRVEWTRRMFNKGFVNLAQKNSEELALKKAAFALQQAQANRLVLVEHTKGKTIKELESDVQKCRSDELARKAAWELEKSRESDLERKVVEAKGTGSKAPALRSK